MYTILLHIATHRLPWVFVRISLTFLSLYIKHGLNFFLLQAQMENLNDGSLHENPFDIVDEVIIAAAPAFNIIRGR